MYNYRVHPNEVENIRVMPLNPDLTHKRPFTISIPKDKDESVTEDAQATEMVKVYSDGSALNGKVGVAAIICRTGEPTRKLHYHLGPAEQHTVHEAELVGMLLGLHLIKMERKGQTSHALGVDNQAALSALNSVKSTTGQYTADKILQTAARIKKQRNSANYSLKFRWTAGHVGIEGNEEVDGEAKKAAEGLTSDKKALPPLLRKPLKHNKSVLRQHKATKLKTRSKQEWGASTCASKFNAIDPTLPSKKFIKLIGDDRLSRADASRIFQLRTGHALLNAYPERFKRADNARCPACGHVKEDVQHFLLNCPAYSHERWALLRQSKM
jgi:ribonuclease HI